MSLNIHFCSLCFLSLIFVFQGIQITYSLNITGNDGTIYQFSFMYDEVHLTRNHCILFSRSSTKHGAQTSPWKFVNSNLELFDNHVVSVGYLMVFQRFLDITTRLCFLYRAFILRCCSSRS